MEKQYTLQQISALESIMRKLGYPIVELRRVPELGYPQSITLGKCSGIELVSYRRRRNYVSRSEVATLVFVKVATEQDTYPSYVISFASDTVRFLLRFIDRIGMDSDRMQRYIDYRYERRKNERSGTKSVYTKLTATPQEPLAWQDVDKYDVIKRFQVNRDGFIVTVVVENDWDYDFSNRGTFSDTWDEDAVANPRARYDRGLCKYFHPAMSKCELRKALTDLGYSRSEAEELARSSVREDLRIAAEPDAAGFFACSVSATAVLNGVELGSASLSGIDTDERDDPYINETARELIEEAVNDAKKKLAELKAATLS